MPTAVSEEVVTRVRERRRRRHSRRRRRRRLDVGGVLPAAALSLVVAYLAWHRGGVDVADQALVFTCLLAFATLAAVWGKPLGERLTLPWPALLIPLLPLVQLLSLPPALWEWISSAQQGLIGEFARHGVRPEPQISIYPYATLRDAVVLAGCCAVFCVSRMVARRSRTSQLALLAPLMVLAVGELVLGLHQHIRGQRLDDPLSQFAHGTFVNRDHYAALLEGILGPALGLVFATVATAGWKQWFQGRDPAWTIAALAVAAACGLGVVFSFSRMGVIVVAVMTLVTLVGAMRRQRLVALLVGGGVLSGVLLAGAVGLRGLPERFSQLIAERGDPFRVAVWLDSLDTAAGHLWTGSGLGTFAFAFRRSEPYLPLKFIDHAHSEYLELLVELGLPATLFLLSGGLYLLFDTVRQACLVDDAQARWLAFGCLLGVAGILLHSAVDFPLRMPAVAALVALLFGCARGIAEGSAATDEAAAQQEQPDMQPSSSPEGGRATPTLPKLRNLLVNQALPVLLMAGFSLLGASLLLGQWEHLDAETLNERAYASMAGGHPQQAERLYIEALRVHPYSAALWLKRSEIAEMSGDMQTATQMAELARSLEPNSVRTEWPLAHLYLRAGEIDKATRPLGLLAASVPSMRTTIFDTAWDAAMSPGLVTSTIVPRDAPAVGEYLCYLARRQAWDAIVPACHELGCADLAIAPKLLRYTFDKMFEAGRGREYRALWRIVATATPDASHDSFAEPAGTAATGSRWFGARGYGLDWVQQPIEDVSVAPREDEPGGRALEVHFLTPLDLAYSHLRHDFLVEPDRRYVLEADVRAEKLTGSEGVRLLVQSPAGALATSDGVLRTTLWRQVKVPFRAGPADHVLRLLVVRDRSRKLDKFIQGRFYLRNVRVQPLG